MLPAALAGSYQQYKHDTDSVAAWLASTAKSCGYPADLLGGSAASKGSGRLKGKARAEAKKKQASSTVKPTTLNKYIIKLKDFISLAEFIAAKPSVSVPASLGTTLNRVIAVRSGFAAKLEANGAATNVLSDAKHGYFVGVLEKVRDVLKPRTKPSSTDEATAPHSDKSDKAMIEEAANLFSALKVYEPSEDFSNAPNIERPKKVESDNVTYEAETPTSFEDLMIALTLLINDINSIRSRIQWIWSNYRDGFFDLAAAAIATNTAIDLARNLMEDVVPMFKDHGGIWEVLNKFYLLQAMMKGYDPLDLFPEHSDNFNYDTYDIADGTYILTCMLMDAFTRVVEPQQVPLYKEGMFGYYDPQSDRASKSGYQKFEEDRVLLMSFFTELMAVERGVHDYPVEDEFLRGIRELDKIKQVPFYLVFAAQVFLDIHYTLRTQAERGFETLMTQLDSFNTEIDKHFEFHKDLKIDNWPATNDQMMRQIQTKIKHIKLDPVYKVKVKAYRSQREPVPPNVEPNRILKMSPVLSGLMLYYFRAEIFEVGISIANAWGSITYSVHLYNALQSEKLLHDLWPDLSVVQTLLGDSNFFVGDRPTNLVDYFKRVCLQMGTTASMFTSKRRQNTSMFSRAGPRGIKEGAPVSCMFLDRYFRGTGQVDWTPEHVAKIIDLGLWGTEGSEEEGTLMLGQIDDPEKLKEKAKTKTKERKTPDISTLPPEQLIRALMFALQGEALEFTMPYMAMHRKCWELLRAVRKVCDPLLRQMFGPAYIEQEYQLPLMVGYILSVAVDKKDVRLMQQAADALGSFILTEGSAVIKLTHSLGFPIEFQTERET
ncbi:hypothetical protein F5X99DRAFT_367839 [Biscogniauxia marginata]|nr:hypothetical protein F5X99DRAFT_367839 [Biscogniauxia marginata]